jgi:transcriptional repressor NrdR
VKVIDGVRKAFSGRPVDEDALARLGQQVEETVRASGSAEIEAHEIGLAILEPLSELDEVAYIRFASVYRNFTSLDDYVIEVATMRASQSADPGAIPAAEALN